MIRAAHGIRAACRFLHSSRATIYRKQKTPIAVQSTRSSHRKLSDTEYQNIIDTIHSERFIDSSIRTIYATLLDEGVYLASISTLYRILRKAKETRERRRIAVHPARVKPELVAIAPNCVWSWDITKLAGPRKWVWYHLYVVLDVYSRFVVGWRLEYSEDGKIAEELFADAIVNQGVNPSLLTVHADNGSAMTAKTLGSLFTDLNITRSHSRPHVSNDNPFSESQFKTMKYGPTYPERFENIQDARQWCEQFFAWYNHEHRHTGIALLTPAVVHIGRAEERRSRRRVVLRAAHAAHPERFVRGLPEPPRLPAAVYINPPEKLIA
jgi:putative transposase